MLDSARSHRCGFSRIDAVVLVALFVLPAGLLPGLLVRMRESAVRTQCSNNLRNVVIAMHNFHDQIGSLPPAVGPVPPGAGDGTVLFHFLPYLEQDKLYTDGRDDDGNPSPWGREVYAKPVPLFLCPADASGGQDHLYHGWLATSNYGANYLVFEKGGVTLAKITDGLSNTMAFTERRQICADQPCAWAYSIESDWAPVVAYSSYAKFQLSPTKQECNPALAQSAHAGGIPVAMCDGSVHHITSAITSEVWYHIMTPAGGEVITLDP
jgi:prepilin-type processing-associated H-X9-DG protein